MGLVKAKDRAGPEQGEAAQAPDLLLLIKHASPACRREAAHALMQAGDAAAVPALLARIAREEEVAVREAIFTALAGIGGAAVVEGMIALLRSEDAGLRNGAVEVLQLLPEPTAARIETMLADADADVRILAVNVVGSLPRAEAPRWLCRVLAQDPDPRVCGTAVDALAEAGGPEAVEPLRQVARRFADDPYIAFAARLAIRRIQGGGG
jgi:HEAT repeat protein